MRQGKPSDITTYHSAAKLPNIVGAWQSGTLSRSGGRFTQSADDAPKSRLWTNLTVAD